MYNLKGGKFRYPGRWGFSSFFFGGGDLVLTLILLDTISKVSGSFIKELVGKFGTNQIFQKEKLRNE